MKCETFFFNMPFFRRCLRRFWALGAVQAAALLAALPGDIIKIIGRMDFKPAYLDEAALRSLTEPSMLLSAAFSAAMAIAVLSWLFSDRAAAFTAALPVGRTALYISSLAAGFVLLLGGDVLAFLCGAAVEAANHAMHWTTLLTWLGGKALIDLAFFGCAAFCCLLTGNLLAVPVLFGIVQSMFFVLEEVGQYLLGRLVWGAGFLQNRLTALSPIVHLLSASYKLMPSVYSQDARMELIEFRFTGWGLYAAYAVSGLLLAFFGWLLLRRRRMESAGDIVAVPVLKPVFRVCLALAFALGIAVSVSYMLFPIRGGGSGTTALTILFLMLLGGFFGRGLADVLLARSLRAATEHWRGSLIFAGVLCLLVAALHFDAAGFERRLPPRERVASVEMNVNYGMYEPLREPENIEAAYRLHRSLIGSKTRSGRGPLAQFDDRQQIWLIYRDAAGDILLQRRYLLEYDESADSVLRETEALLNTPEAILGRLRREDGIPVEAEYIYRADYSIYHAATATTDSWFENVYLSPEEAEELFRDCLLPDMQEGTANKVYIVNDEAYRQECCAFGIGFSLHRWSGERGIYGEEIEEYEYVYVIPTVHARRTMKWLSEHSYPTATVAEVNPAEETVLYSPVSSTSRIVTYGNAGWVE